MVRPAAASIDQMATTTIDVGLCQAIRTTVVAAEMAEWSATNGKMVGPISILRRRQPVRFADPAVVHSPTRRPQISVGAAGLVR